MTQKARFVLDTNVFIQSKRRFYGLDFCPGYWDALIWHHESNQVCSIDRVKDELESGNDDLWEWARDRMPPACFATTDDSGVIGRYAEIITWVQTQGQFLPQAKADFAATERADAWLVAYAKHTGGVLVTLEEFDPAIRKRVPIPNVCRAFSVDHIDTFEMLRRLKARFTWQPPVSSTQ